MTESQPGLAQRLRCETNSMCGCQMRVLQCHEQKRSAGEVGVQMMANSRCASRSDAGGCTHLTYVRWGIVQFRKESVKIDRYYCSFGLKSRIIRSSWT